MKAVRIWNRRFCYVRVSTEVLQLRSERGVNYHWDTESHRIEGERRDEHPYEDDPLNQSVMKVASQRSKLASLYHRVLWPTAPAFCTIGELVGMAVGTGAIELDEVMVGRGMGICKLVFKRASTGSIILTSRFGRERSCYERMMDVNVDVDVVLVLDEDEEERLMVVVE